MFKRYVSTIALASAAAFLIACGGVINHVTNPGPTPAPTSTASLPVLGFHATPGSAGSGALTPARSTSSASLPGAMKYMATWLQSTGSTSTAINMSFSGSCPFLVAGVEDKIYGLGQLDGSTNLCGAKTGTYGTPVPTDGAPVIGPGNLAELHVFAQSRGGSTAGTAVVKVYLNGNASTMGCSLGPDNVSGLTIRCADSTNLPAVSDNDMVAVTITPDANFASNYQNVRVLVGKQ